MKFILHVREAPEPVDRTLLGTYLGSPNETNRARNAHTRGDTTLYFEVTTTQNPSHPHLSSICVQDTHGREMVFLPDAPIGGDRRSQLKSLRGSSWRNSWRNSSRTLDSRDGVKAENVSSVPPSNKKTVRFPFEESSLVAEIAPLENTMAAEDIPTMWYQVCFLLEFSTTVQQTLPRLFAHMSIDSCRRAVHRVKTTSSSKRIAR
jgi:hypothetical protein